MPTPQPQPNWPGLSPFVREVAVTADLDTETISERVEAACRERMALLHRTPLTWETRGLRDDLAVEVEVLLDQFNQLTLGR